LITAATPTTSGYGIVADELVTVLAAAGVVAKRVDFTALRQEDSLNQGPPARMTTAFDIATPFLARLLSRGR
jgi:hypothetical protein